MRPVCLWRTPGQEHSAQRFAGFRPSSIHAAAGFTVAATTGAGLLATKATEYVGNPFIIIKFLAIALGLINVLALNLSIAWQARGERELSGRENRQLAVLGGLSLASWLTAITAGRMIGYW